MFKNTLVIGITILLCIGTSWAGDFNCQFPDFGQSIDKLNLDGRFIKYMEKDGVTYYHYTGPCRLAYHDYFSVTITYGFVNDRLYARIIHIMDISEEDFDFIVKKLIPQVFSGKTKVKRQNEWYTIQGQLLEDQVQIKAKYNLDTREFRDGLYYLHLKEGLKESAD